MTRYGFVFNLNACGDLRGCMLACKDKTKSFLGSHYTETFTSNDGEMPHPNLYFMPARCQHCAEPKCVEACEAGVLFKRDDGIVAVGDTSKCEACEGKPCIDACAYKSIELDRRTGRIGKCDMCADRIDAGELPACAKSCLNNAIFFGDFDDEESPVGQAVAAWGESGMMHELLPENKPAHRYLLSRAKWTGMDNLYSPAWHDVQ